MKEEILKERSSINSSSSSDLEELNNNRNLHLEKDKQLENLMDAIVQEELK